MKKKLSCVILFCLFVCVMVASAYAFDRQINKSPMIYERYADNTADDKTFTDNMDVMVQIVPSAPTHRPFMIDVFEATISKRRAWSVPGETPTTKLRYAEAGLACDAAGKRLCTVDEWRIACRGGSTKQRFFNNPDYLLKMCDFARSKGYDKQDFVNLNNSHPRCVTREHGIHHMLGNVAEFVEGPGGQVVVLGPTYYDAHITDKKAYMKAGCEVTVHKAGAYPENQHNEGLGFRCCRDIR